MKRWIVLLALLLCPSAWATTTVTGKLQNLGTGNVTSAAFVRFWLRGCAGNQPRVNGTAIIAPSQGGVFFFDISADSGGNISGTIFSTRDAAGTGNGDIECGGSKTAVWYGMQVFVSGKGGPEIPIHAKNGVTLDITQVTPLTTNPTITAPTGDSTYLRLDAGNSPVTGNLAVSGTFAANGGATSTTLTASGLITANAGITSAGPNTLNGGGTTAGAWTHVGTHTFAGNPSITLGDGISTTPRLRFLADPTHLNWQLSCQDLNSNECDFTPSTAVGGLTFSNPSIKFSGNSGDVQVPNPGSNSASVVTVGGTQTLTNKKLTGPIVNGVCYIDGVTYTTIMGAYTDTTNCKVVAVPTLGGTCYTETVSSTWTLNRAGVPIIFLGCATVTFGTNVISVPQGTGTVSILAPMGPQNAQGVIFSYTGSSSFLTVGSSAGSTLNPTFKNIRFDLTGAGNASIGLDTKFAGNCDYDVDVRGNGGASTTQIALKFDGTGTGGSSCTGKTVRATVAAVNIGLYGTGTGANAFNNNDVAISTTGLNGTTPQLVSIDQGSADNRIYISNCQTLTTCIHASGTAQFNTFYSANQSITNDVVFDASTTNNVAYLNAGITAFSDTGVHNRVIPNGSNPGVMSFSCTGVLTASSTLLLTGGACTTTSATGGPQWPIDNGNWIYRNLRCTSGAGGVNASSGVVTVRNVGNPTSLTATFGTGTAANDLNSAHALIGPGPGSVLDVTITSQIAETLKNIACTLERE